MSGLDIGLQLPEVEREVRWREVRAMSVLAEEVGIDSLWVGDHLLYRDEHGEPTGPWEAWTSLAALAEATTSVRIGPLVASTAFHAPAMLAKQATTIDEISGGRLVLGLGAGWNEVEFAAFGFPYDRRVARFEEAFDVIRRLVRGEDLDLAGEFTTLVGATLRPRPRPGGLPIMIGSVGPRMLSITMPHADAWNAWYAWYGNRPEGLAPLMERVDAACESVGRDPATVARTATVLVAAPGGAGRVEGGTVAERHGTAKPVRGTTEEVAAALAEFGAAGLSEIQIVLDPITLGAVEWLGGVVGALRA